MFESIDWVSVVVMGIGATLLLDVWSFMLAKVFAVSSLNFCLVGRWVSLMRTGQFRHTAIGKAKAQNKECALGWLIHYLVGIIFALVFLMVMPNNWLESPTFWQALLFGVLTVCMPFFVMQPALGLGIAARNTEKPVFARVKSCAAHCVFGIGLYFSALLLVIF
ncbi:MULTISPECIES: DUF2938 domain-containing protein [Pseudoalteromonas]|uniref:DUF2938 domain-containing protein n=1 Tax=Pseudoalteromonas TaxID=53246 RepID=UPI0002F5A269|nr:MULTISPECIES: DUF2938 domain-containing protein [Pseudoalteromonas]MCF6146191.1 hypothetical protein [Pseudoalteromonas mariniglutinosa NCIMB 1770]